MIDFSLYFSLFFLSIFRDSCGLARGRREILVCFSSFFLTGLNRVQPFQKGALLYGGTVWVGDYLFECGGLKWPKRRRRPFAGSGHRPPRLTSVPAVGSSRSAASPNFGSEPLALFLGCFVDDLPAGVDRAAYVLQRGFSVIPERARSGVELVCPLALPGSRHRETEPGIAALTEPAEIVRRAV
jgi:hypothetical protein